MRWLLTWLGSEMAVDSITLRLVGQEWHALER